LSFGFLSLFNSGRPITTLVLPDKHTGKSSKTADGSALSQRDKSKRKKK